MKLPAFIFCMILIAMAIMALPACDSKEKSFRRDTAIINLQIRERGSFLTKAARSQLDSIAPAIYKMAMHSHAIAHPRGEADAYDLLGRLMFRKMNKDSARLAFQKAIGIYTRHQIIDLLAPSYARLADTYDVYSGERNQRISYYEEAAKYYGLSGKKLEQANTLQQIGDYCIIGDDYLKAQRVLQNALDLYQQLHFPHQQGAYYMLSQVFTALGNYKKAIELGRKAVVIAGDVKDSSTQVCTIYNMLGIPLLYSNNYDSAASCFEKALAIAQYHKDDASRHIVVRNLADTYIKSNRFEDCIKLVNAYIAAYPALGREQRNAINFFALDAHAGIRDYKNADRYFNALRQSIPADATDPYELYSYLPMIRFKLAIGDFNDARRLMRQGEATYRSHHLQNALKWIYRLQYQADSTEGKMLAAIASYKQYKDVSDSIFTSSREKQVASLEKQFEAEIALRDQLKEQNITLLRTQGKLQLIEINQAHTRTMVLASGVILLLLLIITGYWFYSQQQKSNRLLEKQKTEIDQQNISLKRLVDQQVRLITEKEWLVKEVHHRVKNNLQIINSLLNFQCKSLHDPAAKLAIVNSQHRINAISFIHQRLYKTDSLGVLNIENYVQELVQYLTAALTTDVKIHFNIEVLPEDIEIARIIPIGLILNEAVTNAIKYAFHEQHAPMIHIGFDYDGPDYFVFVIADNGKGFPSGYDWSTTKSLGFNILQTMAEQLEADFTVNGSQGLELNFRFKKTHHYNNLPEVNETYYV
jgi:two-component system, sensor histidine kinase PdtaS